MLIAGNLIPLAGVLFLNWDVAALVLLYWSENLILGAYNILKMFVVGGLSAIFTSAFFLIHYGGFCAVHGFFIATMLLEQPIEFGGDTSWPFFFVFLELLLNVVRQVVAQVPAAWLIAFLGLVISHGYSLMTNFFLAGEKDRLGVQQLMAAPYKRIVILHIAVILGGIGAQALGQPMVLLLALVALKIVVDLVLHQREHRGGEST